MVFEQEFNYLATMRRIKIQCVWLAGFVLLVGSAQAAVGENHEQHYGVILTRNAFGLKPAPKVEEAPAPTAPAPAVNLTGIIGLTAPKKVLLVVTPVGKGTPQYLTINEGESSEDMVVKVVEIDEQNGNVKIAINGATSMLNFEKNGIKNPTVASAPGGIVNPGTSKPSGPSGLQDASLSVQYTSKLQTSSITPTESPAPANLQAIPARQVRTQPQ